MRWELMMKKIKRERIAKYITVGGSFFWIFAGLWGVLNCLDTAKVMKAQYVQILEINRAICVKHLQ